MPDRRDGKGLDGADRGRPAPIRSDASDLLDARGRARDRAVVVRYDHRAGMKARSAAAKSKAAPGAMPARHPAIRKILFRSGQANAMVRAISILI
jgi:hypothetical protein